MNLKKYKSGLLTMALLGLGTVILALGPVACEDQGGTSNTPTTPTPGSSPNSRLTMWQADSTITSSTGSTLTGRAYGDFDSGNSRSDFGQAGQNLSTVIIASAGSNTMYSVKRNSPTVSPNPDLTNSSNIAPSPAPGFPTCTVTTADTSNVQTCNSGDSIDTCLKALGYTPVNQNQTTGTLALSNNLPCFEYTKTLNLNNGGGSITLCTTLTSILGEKSTTTSSTGAKTTVEFSNISDASGLGSSLFSKPATCP